jgi:uncharacterized cupin superfamily protein
MRDTNGRYALIDMLIPAGGGPPPHRHDFEEMFHVLEGQVEVTLRGETSKAHTGETVNVPALAPHSSANASRDRSRSLPDTGSRSSRPRPAAPRRGRPAPGPRDAQVATAG